VSGAPDRLTGGNSCAYRNGFVDAAAMDSQWLESCICDQWGGYLTGWVSSNELVYYLRGASVALIATGDLWRAREIQWLVCVARVLDDLP
jgi:hypothetical protein